MLFLPVGGNNDASSRTSPVSDGSAATLLRPLHAVGCILTDITREPSSLHRRTEWLAGLLELCHLQGFQGHYRERFPSGGYLKAIIIA